ncbi:MAG TPA: hypothetical protein VF591_25385 [Pyrinomonadaceae bacterium]
MSGHLGLLLLLLLSAGLAHAQTPSGAGAKPTAEAKAAEAAPVADGARATAAGDEAAPTPAAAASTPATAALTDAGVEPPQQGQPAPAQCKRKISADVVAVPQPIMLNRLGAAVPDGLMFALKSDTEKGADGNPRLKGSKRPRPLVLRANVGDCLTVNFTNAIPKDNFGKTKVGGAKTNTTEVSIHVQGVEWASNGTAPGSFAGMDDGTFVGTNNSSLASAGAAPANMPPSTQTYTLYAKAEGTYLLYTTGDTSTQGLQLQRGLFGALNVEPEGAEWYRSQVTAAELALANSAPAGKHPVIDYAKKDPSGVPVLNMLDPDTNKIVHSDLTAIITGPSAGRFPGTTGPNNPEPACNAENLPSLRPANGKVDPLFCANPASPDRKQPYREVTLIYHEVPDAVTAQAFPVFQDQAVKFVVAAGKDAFAINYGTGGIASEVYANRIGVGPMGSCVDCKFEEFFLSSWSVGDPAMLVDKPANSNNLALQSGFQTPCNTTAAFEGTQGSNPTPPNPNCANARRPEQGAVNGEPYTLNGLVKATAVRYPDDPSNVYHTYINDHVKFRILHGGTGVSHVHHQHAHQWLQSPNSDQASYLDSQMISPGASYTLEMVYNGSGNRNKVVGDSIFHCHFYPHFASGMWALWRTHDVFESGTALNADGTVAPGARALPDGEIQAGTPIPAVVPMPTLPMAPLPSPVFIAGGEVYYGKPAPGADPTAGADRTGQKVKENPGFPFFIPGVSGARAPHPPLDFAPDKVNGGFLDGGLPRHVVTGGTISYERHTAYDWSKDLETMNAVGLPEDGTSVEKVAMKYFGKRCHDTFLPDGTPAKCKSGNGPTPVGGFLLNGLGPKSGAPFADPAILDNGLPAPGPTRVYKGAAIQLNVVFNKKALGWHFQQQRMLALWDDVSPTIDYSFGKPGRPPEPLFFRANSGDTVEYWHTNLVPNYYVVDDFQVRTPTDILGQHIHLVKFDVTSSDGAANGFNYEDGTYSPQEVQEMITAINNSAAGGLKWADRPVQKLEPKAPPAEIFDCKKNSGDPRCQPCKEEWTPQSRPTCQSWFGAQTTIQRWYLDPLLDNAGRDRTLRTVFTHDHYGPSTHQQAGLYAGLLIEPADSTWHDSESGQQMGARADGGPTSWKADIHATEKVNNVVNDVSYREFALEFQDFMLAYQVNQLPGKEKPRFPDAGTPPDPDPSKGYRNKAYALGAPDNPTLISTATVGTHSVNYKNEPIPYRVGTGDLSSAFDSSAFQPGSLPGMEGDPATPLMRAYQGDNVQIRLLVGAHMFAHQFNLAGPRWLAEPSWKDSGYRSAQPMGLSEHFELLFNVPGSSAPNTARPCPDKMSPANCVDYLYSPSFDASGISQGLWGLFRAYDPTKEAQNLKPLPNNPVGPGAKTDYATCPAGAPSKTFKITAVTAQKAVPGGKIVFNDRGGSGLALTAPTGIMYVWSDDLDTSGKLKPGVPVEPLILRANAGDCINVLLTNALDPSSGVFKSTFTYKQPLKDVPAPGTSRLVGLHPQLLSYDGAADGGMNVGFNSKGRPSQLAAFKAQKPTQYQWYAGKIERDAGGTLRHIPVEFGALNLFPSDPLFQHVNGLFGSMIIEPQGSTWKCDGADGANSPVPCDPSSPGYATPPATRASATVTLAGAAGTFREFALMISDDIVISKNPGPNGSANNSAVNYRTEPRDFRYWGNNTGGDFSCMTSNQLIQKVNNSPQTPILTAALGQPVRFRMTHPFGTGTSQVFTVHGHAWQRNPYQQESQALGANNLSQWLGSRDNHGATDHFELMIDRAGGGVADQGGQGGRPGDYLYTVYLPSQAMLGAWGLFRVGTVNSPAQTNAACTAAPGTYVAPQPQPDVQRLIRQPTNSDPKP